MKFTAEQKANPKSMQCWIAYFEGFWKIREVKCLCASPPAQGWISFFVSCLGEEFDFYSRAYGLKLLE